MPGAARFYFKITESVDGQQTLNEGSTVRPVKEFATTGSKRERGRTITLGPGSATRLWAYSGNDGTQTGFDLLTVETDGYVYLAWKCDKPTAADDRTALGTHIVYNHAGCSCNAPFVFPGDDVQVATSSHAPDYDSTTFMSGAEAADGKVYEVWAKNPSATATVSVTVRWVD